MMFKIETDKFIMLPGLAMQGATVAGATPCFETGRNVVGRLQSIQGKPSARAKGAGVHGR
jgi:hypothetical protein